MKKSAYVILFVAVLVFSNLAIYYLIKNSITGYAITDAQVGNLSVGVQTYVACVWSDDTLSVSFGSELDPGQSDINATENYALGGDGTAYNVSSSLLSNVNVDIKIKGADLVSGANRIGVGNVTWASASEANGAGLVPASSFALLTDYDEVNKLATNLVAGDASYFRFWIDIPSGQVAGTYVGNFTQLCEQAA
jgi:hypothetical protein